MSLIPANCYCYCNCQLSKVGEKAGTLMRSLRDLGHDVVYWGLATQPLATARATATATATTTSATETVPK